MEKILTRKDLLEILPFGRDKVNRLLKTGTIPTIKIGRDYIIKESDFNEWMDEYKGKEIHI